MPADEPSAVFRNGDFCTSEDLTDAPAELNCGRRSSVFIRSIVHDAWRLTGCRKRKTRPRKADIKIRAEMVTAGGTS